MSVKGDITPPVPWRQRIGKATASTDSDRNKKILQKNKELTTNQELYSQNNTLATHQCPQKSITSNSTLSDKIQRELGLVRTTRHQCAVVYTVEIYRDTSGTETQSTVNLELPSTNIFWFTKDLKAGCASHSTRWLGRASDRQQALRSPTPRLVLLPMPFCFKTLLSQLSNKHNWHLWEFVWLDFRNIRLHR